MNRCFRWSGCLTVGWAAIAVLPLATPAQPGTGPVSDCAAKAISGGAAQINALSRAKNLARQATETNNGGLEYYRADASMHGPVSIAPCTDNGDGTWTFTVRGGRPGITPPTQETVVTVDGRSWTVKVDYNGPVRS